MAKYKNERYTPIEDLKKYVSSVYKLVVLASRRSQELIAGSPQLIETDNKTKMVDIALEEIRQGKITYKEKEKEPDSK